MQIVKKTQELIFDSTSKVVVVWINKTISADTFHPGHETLITRAKEIGDKVVVQFTSKSDTGILLYSWNRFWAIDNTAYDYAGCINWCVSHNVDAVIWTDQDYIPTLFDGMPEIDINAELELINELYEKEKYPGNPADRLHQDIMQVLKTWMAVRKIFDTGYTYLYSWKEGYARFVQKHFCEKYLASKIEIIDPIIEEDGIYYSSSTLQLTLDQKNIINNIINVVDEVGYNFEEPILESTAVIDYSLVDPPAPNTILLDALNSQEAQAAGIQFTSICIIIGGICGEENDFITIFFRIDNNFLKYPIYKRNVR
jgi:hypothetical protein